MKTLANKYDNKLLELEDEDYILYRVPIDELCGTCNETISEMLKNNESGRRTLIEFYETKEEKPCPAIKQINFNKLMY